MILVLVLEMLERLLGLLEYVLPPIEQLEAEILPLALVHKRLFVRRTVPSWCRPQRRFSTMPILLMGLYGGGSTVFALLQLHEHLLPHLTREAPRAALISKVYDGDN